MIWRNRIGRIHDYDFLGVFLGYKFKKQPHNTLSALTHEFCRGTKNSHFRLFIQTSSVNLA